MEIHTELFTERYPFLHFPVGPPELDLAVLIAEFFVVFNKVPVPVPAGLVFNAVTHSKSRLLPPRHPSVRIHVFLHRGYGSL